MCFRYRYMWYFRDYICGLCWKLQKKGETLKCEERQFVNLFLFMDGRKGSVLDSVTQLKKKKKVFYAQCVSEEHICEGRTGVV